MSCKYNILYTPFECISLYLYLGDVMTDRRTTEATLTNASLVMVKMQTMNHWFFPLLRVLSTTLSQYFDYYFTVAADESLVLHQNRSSLIRGCYIPLNL